MKNFYIFVLSFIFTPLLPCQVFVPQIEWYKIYDAPGKGIDLANDIKMDSKHNVYLAGRSSGINAGQNMLLLKYSNLGDLLLEIRYLSAQQSWDEAASLAFDADSNIFLAGQSSFGQSSFYAILQKYSSDGKLIWFKNFNTDLKLSSEGKGVIVNSKNEIIFGYNQGVVKITKYSNMGDALWIVSIGDSTGYYELNSLIADNEDNIFASITKTYPSGGDVPSTRLIVVMIADSGEIIWSKSLEDDQSGKLFLDKEDDLLLITSGNQRIIKFNSNGDTLWTNNWEATILTDLASDSDNNIIVTGYRYSSNSWDYMTRKLSPDGRELWVNIFNSEEGFNDFADAITTDKENNLYVTGSSGNSITSGVCYIIKYSPEGELKWDIKFDAPNGIFETATHIFVDDSSNIFAAGDLYDTTNGSNLFILKINQDIGSDIKLIDDNIPANFSLSQNFPNPFNPKTKISFSIPESDRVRLDVYDVLGNLIVELLNTYLEAGNYIIDFNASELSSGIYYYRLTSNKFTNTKKAILLK